MASLSEMLAYADYMAKNKRENSFPGRLASLIEAGMSGYERGLGIKERQEKSKQHAFDLKVKQLDYNKKLQDMEYEARGRKRVDNEMKALGLAPIDDNQASAVRSVAFDNATQMSPPKNNTSSGRLANVYSGIEGMDEEISYNTGDPYKTLKHTYRTARKKEENKPGVNMEHAIKMAEAAARREKYTRALAINTDPMNPPIFKDIQVEEDEAAALLPEIIANLEKKPTEAKTLRSQREKADIDLMTKEIFAEAPSAEKSQFAGVKVPFTGDAERRGEIQRKAEFVESKLLEEYQSLTRVPKNRARRKEILDTVVKLRQAGR